MTQKGGELQINQMKKTTLAVAIKEAVRQVGIEHEQQNIFKLLKESFNSKFSNFKSENSSTSSLRGSIFNNYEYPIGDDDRQQYYTGIIYEAKLTGSKMLQNIIANEKKPLVLLEAYSKNQDPKKRVTSKSNSKSSKKEKHGDSIKKKVKKN